MPFDEKPSPGQQPKEGGGEDEFSRLFGALAQPDAAPLEPPPAPSAKPAQVFSSPVRNEAAAPGEFTQVFRQIAKPTSKPPDLDAAPPPAPAAPGEFTQFFSSMDATAAAADPAPPAHPAPQSAPAPAPVPSTQAVDPNSFTQVFVQPPGTGGSAAPMSAFRASPEQPGRAPGPLPFANRAQERPAPNGREPFAAFEEPARTPAASKPVEPNPAASAVTQIFQMEELDLGRPPADLRKPPLPASPVGPASGPGEFTRLMQELGAQPAHDAASPLRSAAPPAQAAPPVKAAPQGGPGEFTRLMQSLEASPAPEEMPVSRMPPSQPLSAAPQPASFQGGPGEFTRLMQSLSSSPAAPAPRTEPPRMPLQPPAVMAGESEFTRVMKGSSLRAGSPVLPEAQVAPAASSPPAAEKPKDKGQADAEPKMKKWLFVLLVSNAVLLLVLIVLAVLFLLHRH